MSTNETTSLTTQPTHKECEKEGCRQIFKLVSQDQLYCPDHRYLINEDVRICFDCEKKFFYRGSNSIPRRALCCIACDGTKDHTCTFDLPFERTSENYIRRTPTKFDVKDVESLLKFNQQLRGKKQNKVTATSRRCVRCAEPFTPKRKDQITCQASPPCHLALWDDTRECPHCQRQFTPMYRSQRDCMDPCGNRERSAEQVQKFFRELNLHSNRDFEPIRKAFMPVSLPEEAQWRRKARILETELYPTLVANTASVTVLARCLYHCYLKERFTPEAFRPQRPLIPCRQDVLDEMSTQQYEIPTWYQVH